jgi:hypothetical protein
MKKLAQEQAKYPKAGVNAPAGVKAEVDKFFNDPDAREHPVLLYHLLGAGTMAYKMPPEDAEYTDVSQVKGQKCSNCEHAYKSVKHGVFICAEIRDTIQPAGWCSLWE